ncbi:SMI1/KNR4 family protein [Nonomuraea sp. NPDC049607]|uniref:SMI1/KNR4 family protein n=1 Tax=Nonomuraea sp. NPDC049607 TaxID=3154732 RepID=UPI0034491354
MITSRGLWWALSAAAVAVTAAVAAIVLVRRSRTPEPPPPANRPDSARPVPEQPGSGRPGSGRSGTEGPGTERPGSSRPGSETGAGSAPSLWPPAPILGTPTKADVERYATRSATFFDNPALAAFFADRTPLDGATRRRLNRWAMVGLAIVVLAGAAQALESAVFSKGGDPATEVENVPCAPAYADAGVRCVTDLDLAVESGSEPDTWWDQAAEPAPADQQPAEPQEPPSVQEMVDADCRPRPAEPHVREIDPKVTRAVDRQWRRIETWLKANAPKSYRTLGAPGKATTIAVAEAQTGLSFPDDLRASLLRHNGSAITEGTWPFGFLGNRNESIREIRDHWRVLCGIDATDDTDDPRDEWWDGRMIPVASDGSGDSLVIDSVRRDVGETDQEGSMSFAPGGIRIRSYHALLKATADALETGGTIGYMKPKAVAGQLEWDVP